MSKNSLLKIRLMGGVDEIGSNMTVFETSKEYLIIDYGILFPNEEVFDLKYLIVDFNDLDPQKKTTLFISHGHEDHIGAVSHIVDYFQNFKIYAPPFAIALIRKKLLRRNFTVAIKAYNEDDVIQFDMFKVHPVHVTHSIPETFGVLIEGSGLGILFISDFKFDLNPLYEKAFNYQKIQKLFNAQERRIVLLDSTNILNKNKTLSERDLLADIDEILGKKGRCFVTLFSSNIYRLRSFFELAQKHKRKITAVGRSIYNYLDAAEQTKIFSYKDYNFFSEKEVANASDEDWLVFLTGSQGDFMGALRRISNGDHSSFKLKGGDRVIFSSKPIPGNESKIYKIYNDITTLGADVVTASDYQIHASGHPGQEDLKGLMEHLNPTDYIPIHGETFFLKKHAQFAKDNFKVKTHFLRNFDSFCIDKKLDHSIEKEEWREPILIHGDYLMIEREKIAERRKIATQGVALVAVSFKNQELKITTRGLPNSIQEHMPAIEKILYRQAFNEKRKAETEDRVEGIRVKTRQAFKNFLGYRPIAIVQDV